MLSFLNFEERRACKHTINMDYQNVSMRNDTDQRTAPLGKTYLVTLSLVCCIFSRNTRKISHNWSSSVVVTDTLRVTRQIFIFPIYTTVTKYASWFHNYENSNSLNRKLFERWCLVKLFQRLRVFFSQISS